MSPEITRCYDTVKIYVRKLEEKKFQHVIILTEPEISRAVPLDSIVLINGLGECFRNEAVEELQVVFEQTLHNLWYKAYVMKDTFR